MTINKLAFVLFFCMAPWVAYGIDNADGVTKDALVCPAQPQSTKKIASGHVLKCPQVPLLNAVLESRPTDMVHLELEYGLAKKTLANLANIPDSAAAISSHVKTLIRPIEQFFDEIRMCASIVKPIIEECVGKPAGKCLLIDLLDSLTKSNATTADYFGGAITTKADLESACRDFISLYLCIYVSLSPDARKAYLDKRNEIIKMCHSTEAPTPTPAAAKTPAPLA